MQATQIIRKYWVEIVLVSAVVLGLVLGLRQMGTKGAGEMMMDNPKDGQVSITVGEIELMVEVRDNDDNRSLGLSGRESLGESEGMLFVFEKKERPTFWMKQMNFDLDMIWIKDGMVVDVSENVPAPTEDDLVVKTATPSGPVDMVLEVNSGWVKKNEIVVGDEVVYESTPE